MKIYIYDKKTKELKAEIEAPLDPLESAKQGKNIYMLPASATFVKPKQNTPNKINIWDGAKWELLDDYRGYQIYNTSNKEIKTIENIGETTIQEGYTTLEPFEFSIWNGKKWVDDIETLKEIQKNKINEEKERAEFTPFTYNEITIDADAKSQSNIQAKMIELSISKAPETTWVTYDNQTITMSSSDFIHMSMSLANRVSKIVLRGRYLKDKIDSLSTKKEIEKIKWSELDE